MCCHVCNAANPDLSQVACGLQSSRNTAACMLQCSSCCMCQLQSSDDCCDAKKKFTFEYCWLVSQVCPAWVRCTPGSSTAHCLCLECSMQPPAHFQHIRKYSRAAAFDYDPMSHGNVQVSYSSEVPPMR